MAIRSQTPQEDLYIQENNENIPLLIAEDIIKIYQTGKIETQALRGVSFKVNPGEKVFLIGPSGSGKTTLVNTVAGIIKPTSGKVFWKDLSKDITKSSLEEIIKARRSFAGVIFQDSRLLSHLTVKENIELAGHYASINPRVIKRRSDFLLRFLNMWEKRDKREDTLSGGEKKRAAIATTLITNPRILIGDEPTGDLDIVTAENILDLFDRINKELGIALCIVTHSQQVAKRADRILELRDGIIIGRHGREIVLRNLEESRLLEMDRQNRLAIPKAILNAVNDPKHFTISTKGKNIILTPIFDPKLYNNGQDVVTCAMCGKRVDHTAKFCPYCSETITHTKGTK